MMQFFKNIVKSTPLYPHLSIWITKRAQKKEYIEWEKNGKPMPPPHIIKQQTLIEYARTFGLKILVETGTYYGYMVEAMNRHFDQIYSIELSKELFEHANLKFKKYKHIYLANGDSGIELKNVINKLDQNALFWLDGHYCCGELTAKGSKDTPIFEELELIFKSKYNGHVIIIDDARCFGGDPSYPSIDELSNFILARRPDVDIFIKNDSIRITPKVVN